MRRKKKFTSALSFVLSLLMAASCVQPVMAAQAVPGVESVSGEAAAQAEGNEDTNVSVSAAPAKEETSEAPAESTENTPTEETAPAETTESTQEESDFDSGSTADLTETKELESESSDAVEPAALSSDSEISPLADTDAYAILYKNGELVFQRGSTPDASKGTVLGTYTGFETKKYTGYNNYAPWHENKASIKTVSFKDAVKPISTAYWFYECKNLTDVDFTNLDTSAVTSMRYMFQECGSLKSLDLSPFNTSAVTSMDYMFYQCSSLTSLDLSSFNTSAVTDMGWMFARCSSLTSLDLSSFNTSAVTSMGSMFYDCRSLTNLNLSSFDTSAVTDMYAMFEGCSALTNLDVSSFDTSAITDMRWMFSSCSSLTSLDVNSFDTSVVTNMGSMFYDCRSLTSLNLSSFDTSAVTSMRNMFNRCSALTNLDVSSFDTSTVTDMYAMFEGCSALTNLDVSSFDTSAVTNMGWMFALCSSLTSLDLSSFNTSAVTSMGYMFNNCRSLTSLDLSSFNTSAITNMGSMFGNCSAIETLTLGTKFAFKGDTNLVDATWHGINTDKKYTTSVLTSTYDGPTMADTYAKYIDIKFDALDGKSSESKKSGYIGMAFDSLPTAEKRGYDFVGWFTEKQGGTQLLVNQPITQSTYYAHYSQNAYAILYESGEMVFQRGSTPDASKGNVLKTYTGFETKEYDYYSEAPWYENRTSVKSVSFKDVIKPVSTAFWFYDCENLAGVDFTNLDTSAVTDMGHMFYNCSAIETLTLGTKFAFKGDTNLVDATWHGINTGKKYTTSVLTSTYDGPTMADTYIKCFDIKFDAMGGKSSESKKTGYIGMAFDSLPTAEKRGYDFVGWFTEKQGGTQLLVNQPITQSTYYAQYTEHKYTITVTNDVAGTMGDKTKDFTFQLKMTGNTPAELHYTKGTETGTLKVTDGVVEFTLSDGESITLGNILIDTTYKITEVDGASNGYAVESTNSSGTLTEDTNVSFTNTRNGTVPTSAHTNILISIGVFAIALAGLFWHLRKRKQ